MKYQNRLSMYCLLSVAMLAALSGCPATDQGAIQLNIDLATLTTDQEDAKADDPLITGVTVTLTRDGMETIVEELDIVDNHAVGTVNDLEEGYWHVLVDAYSGASRIYTGEQDVNVIAGLTVNVTILFDPVIEEPTRGSISFNVGMNPLPGFRVLDQVIDSVMFSSLRNELYLYDGVQNLIAVYDGATFNRIRDLVLPQTPHTLCLGAAEDEFVLGLSSGQIYRLDMESQTCTLAGDVLMDVRGIVAVAPDIVLTVGPAPSNSQFKSFNVATGQILDTKSVWASFQDFTFNAVNSTAYLYKGDGSPVELYRVKMDSTSGSIVELSDSPYHGDYSMGDPIRIFHDGQRLVTSSGSVFSCALLAGTDLTYVENIGLTYQDLDADDTLGYLYLLNKGTYNSPPTNPKLIIVRQDNFFVTGTVDLKGTPKRVINALHHVMVVTEFEGRLYAKAFSKADLALE